MSHISTTSEPVGVLLDDFDPMPERYSLEELMRRFMEAKNVSKAAKKLLQVASPSRCRTDNNTIPLVVIEGGSLPKDPHTEAVRRFASLQGYVQPSLEDALRIFPIIAFDRFSPDITSLVVMHRPVQESLLGFTLENGIVTLSAHKADPREGWFCRTKGFVFRCNQSLVQ
jgi:hypothetical protein